MKVISCLRQKMTLGFLGDLSHGCLFDTFDSWDIGREWRKVAKARFHVCVRGFAEARFLCIKKPRQVEKTKRWQQEDLWEIWLLEAQFRELFLATSPNFKILLIWLYLPAVLPLLPEIQNAKKQVKKAICTWIWIFRLPGLACWFIDIKTKKKNENHLSFQSTRTWKDTG